MQDVSTLIVLFGIALITICDLRILYVFALAWRWSYLVSILLTWQAFILIWKLWWKAPTNVIFPACPTLLGRWWTAFRMLFDSETLLQEAYDAADGKSFAIPMFDRWIVCVSDREHLKELEKEPETTLSRERALRELAFTKQILGGHQVAPAIKGHKSEALRINGGVLQNRLRNSVPERSGKFRQRIRDAVAREIICKPGVEASDDGWQRIRIMPALLRIFTRISLASFIGEDQANCPDVYNNVMQFYWSCAFAFPIVQLLPNFLVPFITPTVLCFGIPRRKVYKLILRLTQKTLKEDTYSNKEAQKQESVVTWITKITRFHQATEIAKLTLGLVFASAFQVPMIAQFCIHRFCKHPKYQGELIAEAQKYQDVAFGSLNKEMPYLDSFIKETARLSPGPVVSSPRTVLIPYTLPDGCNVPTGNWIAVPQLALMRDERIWPRAKTFEGFRFVDEEIGMSLSRLTHPSHEYPLWGSIRHSCPARFYVSIIMKMVLSHIFLSYEIQLADPESKPHVNMGKVRLPNPFTVFLMRKKKSAEHQHDCEL